MVLTSSAGKVRLGDEVFEQQALKSFDLLLSFCPIMHDVFFVCLCLITFI